MSTESITNITANWNQNSTYTGIGFNATDTAATDQSNLIDLKVNNISKFSVDKYGKIIATSISSSYISASKAYFGSIPETTVMGTANGGDADVYINKLRAHTASITCLQMITGSEANITGPGNLGENDIQYIRMTHIEGGGNYTIIGAQSAQNNVQSGIQLLSDKILIDGTDVQIGNTVPAVQIKDGDCVKINTCLEISGAITAKGGMRVGTQSLYLSSSGARSSIEAEDLHILSTRFHITGSIIFSGSITGSSMLTSSTAGSQSGKYLKICIDNQIYKLPLYNNL